MVKNGAEMLCDVLLGNDVDTCFANPGTSEMHFVAALDRNPDMRCVLGLAEGVVTAAADGYARMADKPAATLLHLGPGLANGLANLHNARRARTPMLNVVGDHATYHLVHDAPLTSDIESLARPMSIWVGRAEAPEAVRRTAEEGLVAALSRRGPATMILPADAAWGPCPNDAGPVVKIAPPAAPIASDADLSEAARALRGGRRAALILSGAALREGPLEWAGRIAQSTGASVFAQTSARTQRGAGRGLARPIPYPIDQAIKVLKDIEVAICLGNGEPVAFFAYPGKPGTLLPADCEVIHPAGHEYDLGGTLEALASALRLDRASPFARNQLGQDEIARPTGALDPAAITAIVGRHLPEGAIICEESLTSGGILPQIAPSLPPHDHLPITGGAIGIGIPLAVGAAIASRDRRVVNLQADGSGMYSLQGLWTQARENLDVVTIIYANRRYAILQGEMQKVGVTQFGRNARAMLEIGRPDLDWCRLAEGMGVEAGRAESVEAFERLFLAALARRGPFLIEAVI